ncbi:hypothetical protein ACLN19_08980 [Streptococcus sp. zg-JUN1979]
MSFEAIYEYMDVYPVRLYELVLFALFVYVGLWGVKQVKSQKEDYLSGKIYPAHVRADGVRLPKDEEGKVKRQHFSVHIL